MSECPGCKVKARHAFIKVPLDGSAVSVVHICDTEECRVRDFSEVAVLDLDAIMAWAKGKRLSAIRERAGLE